MAHDDGGGETRKVRVFSSDLIKNLPLRQRLPFEYGPKLEELAATYKNVALYFSDAAYTAELSSVLEKAGFVPRPQGEQKVAVLVHNLAKWLNSGWLVLIRFRPDFADFTLLHLLREVKTAFPACRFEGLVPVFFGSHSSAKQMEVFRHLGAFGIRYVMFLTPGLPADRTLQEMLEELTRFSGLLAGGGSGGKNSAVDMGDEEDPVRLSKYRILVAQGERSLAERRFEESIDYFSKAIALGPDFESLMERGEAYFKSRRYVQALTDFREASRLEKQLPEPYARIGECCLALARVEAEDKGGRKMAEKWFESGMQNLKQSAAMVQKLEEEYAAMPEMLPPIPFAPILNAVAAVDIRGVGMEAAERETALFAMAVLDKIQKQADLVSDISAGTRIDTAVLLARYGRYEEAEKTFRAVISDDPENAGPAFNNFAVELRKNGLYARALDIYAELLKYDVPDRGIVVENMKQAALPHAAALKAHGLNEKAAGVLQTLLAQKPHEPEWILCELSRIYLEMDDRARASRTFVEAVYANPRLMDSPRFAPFAALGALRDEVLKKLSECGFPRKPE